MSRQTLDYVGDFIRAIHKNLEPEAPAGHSGLWISRPNEGSLFLDGGDRLAYTATVDRLVNDFAKTGDLSRRSVERYLQDSLFHCLDIPEGRKGSFDERLSEALGELRNRLRSPGQTYRCFEPVHGFAPQDLPFTFGGVRFVAFGLSHRRQLLKPIGKDSKSKSFRRVVDALKERQLWGSPYAVVDVKARDFDSAAVRARAACRAAVDSINFRLRLADVPM